MPMGLEGVAAGSGRTGSGDGLWASRAPPSLAEDRRWAVPRRTTGCGRGRVGGRSGTTASRRRPPAVVELGGGGSDWRDRALEEEVPKKKEDERKRKVRCES
jgi:hypothetical protein